MKFGYFFIKAVIGWNFCILNILCLIIFFLVPWVKWVKHKAMYIPTLTICNYKCSCIVNYTSWCLQSENHLLVIINGHFINEQNTAYTIQVYCTDSTKWAIKGYFHTNKNCELHPSALHWQYKMGYERVFSYQQKLTLFIFTRYQRIKIDIILRRYLNLFRVLLFLCPCKDSVWSYFHVKF